MPLNNGWKEQFAYTSGTVLLWALLLTRLLPIAAAMQLPNGYEYVDARGYAGFDLPVFSFLTVFGALGIADFLIGVTHIGARGLWLASNTSGDTTEGTDLAAVTVKKMDIFCRRTFESVFWVAMLSVIFLGIYPIIFAAIEIQHGLHRLFSVQSHLVGVVLYNVATVAVMLMLVSLVAMWAWHRLGPGTAESRFARLFARIENSPTLREGGSFWRFVEPLLERFVHTLPIFLLFGLAATATFWLSHKAELSVSPSKTIYDKTTSAANVQVQLGGMTSNAKKMYLSLVNSEGQTMLTLRTSSTGPDRIFDLGEGNYAARIDLSGLSPGRYGITLDYDYFEVSLVPLGLHKLRREKWFAVAQQKENVPPPSVTTKPTQIDADKPTLQYNRNYTGPPVHNWVDYLNAISTAVVGLFTIVLALVGIAQYYSTKLEKRAWMVVKAPEPPTTDPDTGSAVIRWQVENRGRTPAWVTSLGSAARIVKAGDSPPEPPTYTMAGPFPPTGTVLPPEGKVSRGVTIPAANMNAVEHGNEAQKYDLYVFGIVGYKDIYGDTHETRYCYRFKTGPTDDDPAPRDFYVGGPSSYIGAT